MASEISVASSAPSSVSPVKLEAVPTESATTCTENRTANSCGY